MYIDSVFNFTGSKYKILDQIIPLFDTSKKKFVDLFAGGGSVYINVLEDYNIIIVNDIIKELIDIQKELVNGDEIVDKMKNLVVDKDDKDGFNELRKSFNEEKTPEKLWALMLCSTNNMMRFNQKFEYNQTFGKRTYNDNTEKKIKDFIEKVRPHKDKLRFNSLNFSTISIKPNAMYYIDPPYGYIIDKFGRIGNTQISEAGYNAYYTKENDLGLYRYVNDIHKTKSSFMISGLLEHNDKKSWILNKLIKDGYNWKEIELDYNKVSKTNIDKKSKEIIVFNYDPR